MNGATNASAAALCAVILLAGGCRPADVSGKRTPVHGKPRSPVDARLEMVGEPGPSGRTTFRLSVTLEVDFSDVAIDIKIPKGSEVIKGAMSWRGDLKAGRLHEMEITALIPEKPHYKVTANIVFQHTAEMKLKKRVVLDVRNGEPVPPDRGLKKGHRRKAVTLKEFLKKKGG